MDKNNKTKIQFNQLNNVDGRMYVCMYVCTVYVCDAHVHTYKCDRSTWE